MGREVRRVPANWSHPRDASGGRYVPLYDGSWSAAAKAWDQANAEWEVGVHPDKEDHDFPYDQWAGGRPVSSDYMPDWPASERTHYMMYEDTSEGTPISPAFATPEELALWLYNNGASMFGGMTASYEDWLAIATGGCSPGVAINVATGESTPVVIGAPDAKVPA